jgi:hypothetical protein
MPTGKPYVPRPDPGHGHEPVFSGDVEVPVIRIWSVPISADNDKIT